MCFYSMLLANFSNSMGTKFECKCKFVAWKCALVKFGFLQWGEVSKQRWY